MEHQNSRGRRRDHRRQRAVGRHETQPGQTQPGQTQLGQNGDGPHGRDLLDKFERGQVEHVLADTAYDGEATRSRINKLKAKACIKPPRNRKTKKRYDNENSKNRNQVEQFFGRIKQFRYVATRYEKTPENFAGFVWLAALMTNVL